MGKDRSRDKRVSLRPLDFEEALADLLATEPPAKNDKPGKKKPRPKKSD